MLFSNKPSKVRFELTNVCNLRCMMCGIWEERPNIEIDTKLFDRLLREPPLRSVGVISLTGGEPFAIENLADYYEIARARHRRAHINISSNGFYTDRTIDFFTRVAPRNTSLTISYDGIRSHDAIRRVRGSGEKLLETARRVQREFPQVGLSLKMVVTSDNHDEILDTAQQCKTLGIAFRFKTLEKLNCHQGRFPSEIDGPDYTESIDDSIRRQAIEVQRLGIETNIQYIKKLIRMSPDAPVPCNCSPRTLFIGVDGKVFLCRRKQEIGNVRRQSLEQIWQAEAHRSMLAEMRRCQDSFASLSYTND